MKLKVRSRYSHPVSVKALNRVVSIMAMEEKVPSWPIFFAIM